MVKIIPGNIGSNLNHMLNNVHIQQAVFCAITIYIVSQPKLYEYTGKLFGVKDKQMHIVLHSIVGGLVFYFGSSLIFLPILNQLIVKEGMTTNRKSKSRR